MTRKEVYICDFCGVEFNGARKSVFNKQKLATLRFGKSYLKLYRNDEMELLDLCGACYAKIQNALTECTEWGK